MRIKATISSFVLVVALYFAYGWGLVPLVLPNPSGGNDVGQHSSIGDNPTRAEITHLLELLPEGGWERDPDEDIHLLRHGQNIILFGRDIPDGRRLTLRPSTIIILPDGVEHRDDKISREQLRQSIVLRAPQYAEIEFDRDFDFSRLPLPNIEYIRLFGRVTVQSGMRDSGNHDDFYLEAENIEITENLTRIETLRNVQFNLGYHSGRGSGLVLELQPQGSKGLHRARFRNLDSLRLVFPEDPNVPPRFVGGVYVPDGPAMTIDVRCRGPFEFAANPAEQGWTASFYQNVEMERHNPDRTTDRLTADAVHLTLSSQPTPGSPGGGVTAAGSRTSPFEGLEPILFVAHGSPGQGAQAAVPARLTVAQYGGITLVGDEIFLDLRRNFMSLSTRKEAGASPHVEMIIADQFRIRSEHTIQYTLGQDGAFGTFISEGRGNLTGRTGEGASAKDFYLTWNEMQIAPHPVTRDQIVLKLSRGITAQMTDFGTMTADSLDLVCNLVPSNRSGSTLSGTRNQNQSQNNNNNLTLDHAIVKENVLFETASGTCRVRQLTIFFTNVIDGRQQHSRWMPQMLTAMPPVAPAIAQNRPTQNRLALNSTHHQPILQVQHLQPLTPQHHTPQHFAPPPLTLQHNLAPMQSLQLYQPSAVSAPAPVLGNLMQTPLPQPQTPRPATGFVETQNLLGMQSSPNGGRFEMTGDQMWMKVRMENGQSFAERVDIEGNVRLIEHLAGTPATGIEISGNTVMIWNPADPTTRISILGHATGGDAIFRGKGIELQASTLNISRPDNTFWSPGPGRLIANTAQVSVPGQLHAAGRASANTDDRLVVEWNREMVCDGLVLRFEGQQGPGNRVRVLHQTQTLWCNILEVQLNRRMMFFDDPSPVEPRPVEIRFAGDVVVQNQQLDAYGRQKSIVRARVANLHYDIDRDYFIAEGPGEVSSVFLGSGQGFDRNLVSAPANQNNNEGLNCLAVWFQNDMQGTLLGNNRKVEIRGRVQAVFYPAANWEDVISRENISAIRRIGYILMCEQLMIVEVPNPLNLSQSFMELTASTDASIEGRDIFGMGQRIMYNQAKNTVQMDSNVHFETTTQGRREAHTRVESIRYNLETQAIEFLHVRGVIGQ